MLTVAWIALPASSGNSSSGGARQHDDGLDAHVVHRAWPALAMSRAEEPTASGLTRQPAVAEHGGRAAHQNRKLRWPAPWTGSAVHVSGSGRPAGQRPQPNHHNTGTTPTQPDRSPHPETSTKMGRHRRCHERCHGRCEAAGNKHEWALRHRHGGAQLSWKLGASQGGARCRAQRAQAWQHGATQHSSSHSYPNVV